jgi:hypothetical protein
MTTEAEGAGLPDAEDTAAVLAQAQGEKTYLEPKPEPEAAADPPGEDAAAEPDPGPKTRKSAQDRIDELTAARRNAERDAEYWREMALRHAPKPDAAPQSQPQGDGKPDPEKFEAGVYDPAYIEALTDWKANQAVASVLERREGQSRAQTALQTFDQRVREQFPDGEPEGISALRRAPVLPPTMFDLITGSDVGPKIADHLGSHPAEFQRISALPPHMQGAEIARLEQRLATPAAVQPKTVTEAPEPAPTLRGSHGRFKVAADTNDFSAFEKQYLGG